MKELPEISMTEDEYDNRPRGKEPAHKAIRYIMHLWPQHIWKPKDIEHIIRLEYTKEEFAYRTLARHLQRLKHNGFIEHDVSGGWILPYIQFTNMYIHPKPLWFKKWPFLQEVHYHEVFVWDNYNPFKTPTAPPSEAPILPLATDTESII